MLHNMQFSFYSNLYLCMSFLSYNNNIVFNVTINLKLIILNMQPTLTHNYT